MNVLLKIAFALALPLMLAGCGDQADASADAAATPATDWRLDAPPADAVDVRTAKADATDGQTIALRGRIGGRIKPISPDAGLFILMDKALPSCADMGHGCPTPWDYCCEAPETISTNAVTVQLRDATGQPIPLQPDELSPLEEVVVVGTVAPRPNPQTLVLHATGVYTAPAPPSTP